MFDKNYPRLQSNSLVLKLWTLTQSLFIICTKPLLAIISKVISIVTRKTWMRHAPSPIPKRIVPFCVWYR